MRCAQQIPNFQLIIQAIMASIKEQKALANLTLPGPLQIISLPVPIPGPNDVLVKIESVALNPAEYKTRKRGAPGVITECPALIGQDGAGVVVELGADVKNIKLGDRV